MWTVLIVLILGALHCAVSSLPSPINVTFSSLNLRNILQWLPGNGTPDDAHFTVKYAIYGDSVKGSKGRRLRWRAVQQCTEIVRSWCDLSIETGDLEQGYYARVRAVSRRGSSKWVRTWRRFDPKSDTTFGIPLVSVEIEDNSAIITLKAPMRYQPNNRTPVVSMATLYPHMSYNLSIYNTHRDQVSHFPVFSSPYKYQLMEYDTDYCFSAKTRFLSVPVECQSSEWDCITTPPDPVIGQLKTVVVGIVIPSACMCMLVVVGYLLYHYLTGKGQNSPYILNPPSFHLPPLMLHPENVNGILFSIIKPLEIKSTPSKPARPKQPRPNADPSPGYVPQMYETPEPEEAYDNLSIDYVFIGKSPKIDQEKDRERSHDGGKDWKNLNLQDAHSAGVYAPQARSNLSQKSTHICSQTCTPIHTQTRAQREMSTLVQAQACSQVNSVPLTQTQPLLLSFQAATRVEVAGEKEDRQFPELFRNKSKKAGGMGERKVGVRTDGKIDQGVEEGSESEEVPFLSAYASKNINHMSTSHAGQSDFLTDDYGVLRLTTAHGMQADHDEEEEEEERTICFNWDPKTMQIVLPEIAMEFNEEEGLDGLMQEEKGREDRVGREEEEEEEEEEEYVMRGKLRLENVIVRQVSEEEAERAMERGGETDWEVDDIMTKWNLVISMDE